MPLCSLILPPVSVSCTVSFSFVFLGLAFSVLPISCRPSSTSAFRFFPLFSFGSFFLLLLFGALRYLFFPSLLAFQLSIRVRFTQLTSLALLEPLDFRPFGFSPLFSLLMSTFLLLIASPLHLSDFTLRFTEHSTTFPSGNSRFGHDLSLFYLWCNPSPIVRCYAFIIRMAASMPTAYVSSTSHSLPHFNRV